MKVAILHLISGNDFREVNLESDMDSIRCFESQCFDENPLLSLKTKNGFFSIKSEKFVSLRVDKSE